MGRRSRGKRRGAARLLSLAELARRLEVPRYRLSEWVRQGLLPTPVVLGVRGSGRVVAYGFPEADLPRLAERVAALKAKEIR